MKMLRECCVMGPDRVITLACFPCRVFGSGGLAGVISRQVEHLPGPRKTASIWRVRYCSDFVVVMHVGSGP